MYKIKDFFRSIYWFFWNINHFTKQLWEFRTWDSCYNIKLFVRSLELLRDNLIIGNEEEQSRMKKVQAINDLIGELNRDYEHEAFEKYYPKTRSVVLFNNFDKPGFKMPAWIDEETKQLKIYEEKLNEYREDHYNKIFHYIKGQNSLNQEIKDYQKYIENFDGSGIEGWWD